VNQPRLRAAIYIRMSSARQVDSPERQRASILPYCERKNYSVVKEYEDLAVRGDADRRPGFEQLLAGARTGMFDVIVVDEGNRFSRDDVVTYFAQVAYPLRETGVLLDTANRGLVNWSDIGSIITNTVQQHAASQEVVTLSRRVATTLDMRARKGTMYVGRPPLGYAYIVNDEGDRIGMKPGRAEDVQLVKNIFDWYVNRDHSLASLAAELTSMGSKPRSGRAWNRTSLHAVLTNSVYIGEYVFGRVGRAKHYHVTAKGVCEVERSRDTKRGSKVIVRRQREDWIVRENHHEPLIDPELFGQAQRKLKVNQKRSSPSRKKALYPLSGKLVCSSCGARLFGTKDKGKPVYRCSSSQSGLCGNRSVREDRMVALIMEVLEQRFLAPENLDRLREAIRHEHAAANGRVDANLDTRRQLLARLDADIARMEANLGLLDPENLPVVQVQLRKLRQERQAAVAELAETEARSPDASLETIIENVTEFILAAKDGDPVDLRAVIQETIEEVRLDIEMVQKKVNKRSKLVGGEVELKSVALSTTGPGPPRRTGPPRG
jgi:site-specific DNA recombinase